MDPNGPVQSSATSHQPKGLLSSARIVALDMEIKNIDGTLLPRVYRRIGVECLSDAKATQEAGDLIREYQSLGIEIDAINKAEDEVRTSKDGSPSTLAGKAMAAADDLKRRAHRDSLRKKQDALLARIGQVCLEKGVAPVDALKGEVEEVTRLRTKSEKLTQERIQLQRSVPWYAAHPLLMLAAIIILVGLVSVSVLAFRFFPSSDGAREDVVETIAIVDDLSAQVIAQQEELQKMSMAAIEKEEAELNRVEQESQLQEIEEQKAAFLSQEEERQLAEENRIKAQEQLAKLAESLFAQSDLRGAIQVASPRLRQFPVEIRGKNSDKLFKSLDAKDYRSVVGILNEQTYSDYPPASAISNARARLDQYPFKILLSTGSTEVRDREGRMLSLITFRELSPSASAYYQPIKLSNDWNADPSGRGVYTDWTPQDGPGMIALLDINKLMQHIESSNRKLVEELNGIRQQIELGDFSEETAKTMMRRKVAEYQGSIYQWIAAQP